MIFSVFVSCPRGLEYLLEAELNELGLTIVRVSPQGVYGEANLAVIYKLCLWSRLANRIQVILFQGKGSTRATLYQLCEQFAWDQVFSVDKTFAIEFHGSSDGIQNTMFGAQVVKDAIVDYWQKLAGMRPNVARTKPDILIHAHLKQDIVTLSFDVTGYSLHQRGYRLEAGIAPLKENIAAAMLVRAKWLERLHEDDFGFLDPFCGAGTLVIEAAMMAANIAPGLLRHDQAFHGWTMHQPLIWEALRKAALDAIKPSSRKLLGSDVAHLAIKMALANAERAGVSDWVTFKCCDFSKIKSNFASGLIISNPPYGERLGDEMALVPMFQQFGQILKVHFPDWSAAILTSKPMLTKATGLRSHKQYTLFNGQLECKLFCFALTNNHLRTNSTSERGHAMAFSSSAQMFANRLAKNFDHLRKWAKRHHITCYRIYDADLPEYAYAIDLYQDYVVLHEYTPPASIAPHLAEKRRLDVLQVVPHVLKLPTTHIVHKERQQQKGTAQYQRLKTKREFIQIQEGNAQFWVNLYDYLDTGLFLDHRLLRLKFAELPRQTRFLNCFCYTATASVHAALAGAVTTNVDLSNTYLEWAQKNFVLNHLPTSRHQFIQYDCTEWLKETKDRFDVIFLDPPSFSNSKRMTKTLDIQRDHEDLIHAAMRLLAAQGTLYFSTNLRNFKLSAVLATDYQIVDITRATIDLDFKRNQKIHQCFKITHQPS